MAPGGGGLGVVLSHCILNEMVRDLPRLSRVRLSQDEVRDLVTGDKNLLALADRHAIVTPATFWSRHGG